MKTFVSLYAGLFLAPTLLAAAPIDLSGDYQLHLQSTGEILIPEGEQVADPSTLEFTDSMALPGTTDLAKKGPHITDDRPFEYHLSREYDHIGPAYFKRTITIPTEWNGKSAELFLERVMWQSRVWIDGKEIGEPKDSLNTPHIHELGRLTAGKHDLVIRVDNRMIRPIGDKGHAYGAQTQSLWNGIVGKIELRPVADQHIDLVRVFPLLTKTDEPNLKVEVTGNYRGKVTASVTPNVDGATDPVAKNTIDLSGQKDSPTNFSLSVPNPEIWSEFNTKTYRLTLTSTSGETLYTTTFGFRSVERKGNQLLLNGQPAFMRGNLECAVFPLTGHPPVTVEGWKKVWQVYKDHNLNHARFHSWCPPEAAFIAADELGIYLQVEAPIWMDWWMNSPNPRKEMDTKGYPLGLGKGDRGNDQYALAEIRRTLDTYGNHPSFVFFAIGNELGTSDFEVTGKWMGDAKKYDPRHLYAASTARNITPFCDFNATHDIPNIGPSRQRMSFGNNWDFEPQYGAAPVPIIAHEIGQWPVYVDWETELPKYTGPLKPYRLQDMAAEAKKNGLYDRAKILHHASGKTNELLYRYEIESFLRTPSCRGFQLLGMQDFSGQGEALVGWLDSFYESKGTTDTQKFRQYCAPTVPLLKLPSFVFSNLEKPQIEALVSHYGPSELANQEVTWSLTIDGASSPADRGSLNPDNIPNNAVTSLGSFTPDLSSIGKATQAELEIKVGDLANSYAIWIFPEVTEVEPSADLLFATDWEKEAKAALAEGKTVLLSAHLLGGRKATKLAHWMPLYWSVPFFPGQGAETIGLHVDADHPAFAGFPTPDFGAWLWHRICGGARGFDLTDITPNDFTPIAEPVSDFHLNRRLGSIFELKVGKGKLLVCGYDITAEKAKTHPEVAQLRKSLHDYASSETFKPTQSMESEVLDDLFYSELFKLQKLPEKFTNADLYVNAAGKLFVEGQNVAWDKENDQILRQFEGVDYSVSADGTWRDADGCAWHGGKATITVTPRSGVGGTFYVRFHDWNKQGRTGKLSFEGKTKELGAHTEGVWVEFPVIREDTNDARLILTAEALTGSNLMITDIAFVPAE